MPITVEILDFPSEQDREDLTKIYLDAPDWMLCDYETHHAISQVKQFVQSVIEQPLTHFIGARFNDRLVGAAVVEQLEHDWHIRSICVRKVTRRRGVGKRLHTEINRLAQQQHVNLIFEQAPKDL
ncbi:acetyl-CoA sensor PanZ family protein [Zooshikella harenae]|uniref:Acetyl-CoA sensor PanZ family protein n=1 Tax=Zooshikella harenae TaxID=2827238 RepID=A0ABS5ZIL4_9GAMM|nr:acetyl-CoA sensor PanZ family protein [Zooshikella harenae]MBU2713085.1 acetyl-CoA sensor PanZ family protein [Zooshikella harenae]